MAASSCGREILGHPAFPFLITVGRAIFRSLLLVRIRTPQHGFTDLRPVLTGELFPTAQFFHA